MTARTPQRDVLLDLLGPVVTAQGYELEDLTVSVAGRRSVIKVIVDAVEGPDGIDLDAVAALSRAMSDTLDATGDAIASFAGPYALEVSSPGVDRPLTRLRHWQRAVGRLVTMPDGERTVTGRVLTADDAGLVLAVDGVDRAYRWSEVGAGRVQVEFSRPEDAGPRPASAEAEKKV